MSAPHRMITISVVLFSCPLLQLLRAGHRLAVLGSTLYSYSSSWGSGALGEERFTSHGGPDEI